MVETTTCKLLRCTEYDDFHTYRVPARKMRSVRMTEHDYSWKTGGTTGLVARLSACMLLFALFLVCGTAAAEPGMASRQDEVDPVSYTHLTLPTILRV